MVQLKIQRPWIRVVEHQCIQHRRGEQSGEVAAAISHGTISYFQQKFQKRRLRIREAAVRQLAQLPYTINSAFETAAKAQEQPARATGDVLPLHAGEGREQFK